VVAALLPIVVAVFVVYLVIGIAMPVVPLYVPRTAVTLPCSAGVGVGL